MGSLHALIIIKLRMPVLKWDPVCRPVAFGQSLGSAHFKETMWAPRWRHLQFQCKMSTSSTRLVLSGKLPRISVRAGCVQSGTPRCFRLLLLSMIVQTGSNLKYLPLALIIVIIITHIGFNSVIIVKSVIVLGAFSEFEQQWLSKYNLYHGVMMGPQKMTFRKSNSCQKLTKSSKLRNLTLEK